jgi:hypothetical protein
MKYLVLLITLLFSNVIFGQTIETKLFPLNTYVNNKKSKLSEDALSILSNKINQLTSNLGIGGENPANPRFLLYSKFVINKKNILTGTVPRITINADIYLFVGDAFENTIFSSQIVPIKGYGNTEEAAIIEAIKMFNPNDDKYKNFIESGVLKINNYFQKQCPLIISKSKSLAAEQKYDEAIYSLYNIPESVSSCYSEAHELINKIYLSKINNESAINLKRAKLIWSGAQSKSSIEEILTLLGKINPASTSFGELDSFLAVINKKIESSILRDYQERQEIRKQEIEREKLQVELEKSQMQATKEIAIAYASGTHITNNYTSNAYSSSYSSSNYLSRYYDVLIW